MKMLIVLLSIALLPWHMETALTAKVIAVTPVKLFGLQGVCVRAMFEQRSIVRCIVQPTYPHPYWRGETVTLYVNERGWITGLSH